MPIGFFLNTITMELPYTQHQFQMAKSHLKKGFNSDGMCGDGEMIPP